MNRKKEFCFAKNQSGQTLIELILVILFLSVAILSAMAMMSNSLTGGVKTELLSKATDLANEKMEQVLTGKNSKGYDSISNNNYADEQDVNGLSGFSSSVLVTTYDTYKEVEITVNHPETNSVTLTAFLTNY